MAKKKGGKKKSSILKTVPKKIKSTSITDSINTEVIAEALIAVNQPVLLKLCRLCEAKDGPFLNIFDADKVIAKKIVDLMPFGIEENDELPHKICFRCSAKVEELYEFVQKCIRTQDNLRKAVGNMVPSAKTKTRTLWEEKLNKSNMSNDDICNALIKKAMEGIKDIPLKPLPIEKDKNIVLNKDTVVPDQKPEPKKDVNKQKKEQDATSKPVKMQLEKNDQNVACTRLSRLSNVEPLSEGKKTTLVQSDNFDDHDDDDDDICISKTRSGNKGKTPVLKESPEREVQQKEVNKPFNIIDHISTIKVNGVGMLFQCKLCNRNFLKKDVVMSHACAKNGGPKQEIIPEYLPPNPPKAPVVKYINTKGDSLHPKPAIINEKPIELDDEPALPSATATATSESSLPPQIKSKPKAGPASKVKRDYNSGIVESTPGTQGKFTSTISSQIAPTVQFPAVPSLNSRYKLVPGPNNTFTLVEEKVADNAEYVSSDDSNSECPKNDKDKKKGDVKFKQNDGASSSKRSKSNGHLKPPEKLSEVKETSSVRPYPVGLIKKVGHHSNDYTPPTSDSIAFTTPAMKKQSYTIVQTGNPSKLLISTKPQPILEELPKKKSKKGRQETKEEVTKQPFSVTLEDAAPPKDPAFFTFINVDPLLQPSYVLPTDNIIQESQISTSTPLSNSQAAESKEKDKDTKYKCNMCSEQFSREKKLLTHIHSHYNKMDEEDQLRQKSKKRARRS